MFLHVCNQKYPISMPLAVPCDLSIFGFKILKSQKERRHVCAGTLLHMRANLYLEANQTRTYGGEMYFFKNCCNCMNFVSKWNACIYIYFKHLLLVMILLMYCSLLLIYLCKVMAMQLSRTSTKAKDTLEISNIRLSGKRKYFKLNGTVGNPFRKTKNYILKVTCPFILQVVVFTVLAFAEV